MSFCLTELHLWSLKNTLHIADRDIGIYQYYDKNDQPATEHGNLEEKQKLAESRDYPWTLKNRRPEKLRDSLKELEELMQNSQCVLSKWKNKYVCQVKWLDGLSQCLTNGAENYAVIGILVLSSVRTEWDPLDVRFGTRQTCQVLTVEHSISVDKEPMADSCIYECVRNKIQCVSVTRIPLRSKAISCCRNVTEDKLILGCEDSSVILYETHRGVTLLAQADLLPSLISCHPSGTILLVGSNQGELQIFDMALSPINIQLLAEDRSPRETLQFKKCFDVSSSLVQMQWVAPQVVYQKPESGDIYNLLFLRFDRGPLGVLLFKLGIFTQGQLGLVDIIFQYIHYDEICEAINILSSMNWDTLGHQCFISMSAIVNHLLRQKLTPEREAQLEASLGTFYAPTRPLLDTTILEYRDQISKYARRFFHHLLRYQRFEKAFLLAVDIGARDLFMDIHYLALDKGELALAEVARKRASDIDTESITSGVELLGPLNRGDMLTEAFVGLSLTPQGEDTFPDNLPHFCSIHSHIIQQRTLNVSSNRRRNKRRLHRTGNWRWWFSKNGSLWFGVNNMKFVFY
ncbi:WD repeat-containing and planar cell polarity effector protein fritz homolog [Desmodus rotundus]|uniref:WD repeat-containing and planar cell polarity effector protein fritz homolog n=1 Tax=Desmodus rotundus TaxID=9430 RepID=UPI0039E637A5